MNEDFLEINWPPEWLTDFSGNKRTDSFVQSSNARGRRGCSDISAGVVPPTFWLLSKNAIPGNMASLAPQSCTRKSTGNYIQS